jgi:hypothetical protein
MMWEFILGAFVFFSGMVVGASLVYAVVNDTSKSPKNDNDKD